MSDSTVVPRVCEAHEMRNCRPCRWVRGRPIDQAPATTPTTRWRVGRKVGRTLYLDDVLVGMLDTPELAAKAVAALNGVNLRKLLAEFFEIDEAELEKEKLAMLEELRCPAGERTP